MLEQVRSFLTVVEEGNLISFAPTGPPEGAGACNTLCGLCGMGGTWLISFDLSHGLDGTLTDAVIAPFQAAMVDALTEDHLRCLLTESGEMRRWEKAERETPEGFEILYPLPPLDADALRRLAESATRLEQLEDASFSLEEP
jgi:hypothetical protein